MAMHLRHHRPCNLGVLGACLSCESVKPLLLLRAPAMPGAAVHAQQQGTPHQHYGAACCQGLWFAKLRVKLAH